METLGVSDSSCLAAYQGRLLLWCSLYHEGPPACKLLMAALDQLRTDWT